MPDHEEQSEAVDAQLTRYDEELAVAIEPALTGTVRARKYTESTHASEAVPRKIEAASWERVPASDEDSGEIEMLPDGSVSIPLFEEQLVVTKRLVVRERVIVGKEVTVEHEQVETELRHERIEIERDR